MKRILQIGLLAIGVVWVLSATGNAQISRQYAAHVPFDFIVGNKLMKAGDYKIAPAAGVTDQRAIVLENAATLNADVVGQTAVTSSISNKQGRLTFVKQDGQWLLSDISTTGFELKLKAKDINKENLARAAEIRTVNIGR
jgi:hypothetical protein